MFHTIGFVELVKFTLNFYSQKFYKISSWLRGRQVLLETLCTAYMLKETP